MCVLHLLTHCRPRRLPNSDKKICLDTEKNFRTSQWEAKFEIILNRKTKIFCVFSFISTAAKHES